MVLLFVLFCWLLLFFLFFLVFCFFFFFFFFFLDDDVIHVHEGDMFSNSTPTNTKVALADVKLLAPTQPSKIIALWNNFRALGQKLNLAIPAEPLYLIKSPNSYLNPGETIRKPSQEGKIVFEGG